jgi:Ca2+-binding RTX toxin-like protein
MFAATIEPGCTPGNDTIHLGAGDDVGFGGASGDWIYGDEGQDILLGDFGLYNATQQFLRNQYFESIISSPQWAGGDHIYGGDGDDFIMGQEGSDFIDGGSGADDITGGHNKRNGQE